MLTLYADSQSFCANVNSPRLRFSRNDFFVRIKGYGENKEWAKEVISATDNAVSMIRGDVEPENVFKYIAQKVGQATKDHVEGEYATLKSGILRTFRSGWQHYTSNISTGYGDGRYSSYANRLDRMLSNPLTNPYSEKLSLTRPRCPGVLSHGHIFTVNQSLDLIFEKSNEIIQKFVKKDIKKENLKEFNEKIAEIRWIIAHSTPFLRGSDAIGNTLMRAMYKSAGVKSYPLKKGISLDLEAYCTELETYKKLFATYFEKPPTIVD